ncbi:MAG TPA: hypothetical protein VLD40_01340, partial [Dissulfurispiraceae bacterium]|nr:hypothetical protein [Dissulfurispiraceae bacterium]
MGTRRGAVQGPGFNRFQDLISKYGIEIKRTSPSLMIVIFTELPHNRGTSITDIFEHLATEIYRTYLADIPLLDLVWILRHP